MYSLTLEVDKASQASSPGELQEPDMRPISFGHCKYQAQH